jgi:hypothetical protein
MIILFFAEIIYKNNTEDMEVGLIYLKGTWMGRHGHLDISGI